MNASASSSASAAPIPLSSSAPLSPSVHEAVQCVSDVHRFLSHVDAQYDHCRSTSSRYRLLLLLVFLIPLLGIVHDRLYHSYLTNRANVVNPTTPNNNLFSFPAVSAP